MVDLALAQVRAWRDDGVRMTRRCQPVGMANLLDLDLVDTIDRLLTHPSRAAGALILEITEGTFADDSSRSRNTVYALRRLGVRISIDDYGTGWSSLARLQDLSVDELKLDRVFVSRLARDPRSIAIVRSTVALAHSLGADLVAEGVEDVATLNALRIVRLQYHSGPRTQPAAARGWSCWRGSARQPHAHPAIWRRGQRSVTLRLPTRGGAAR